MSTKTKRRIQNHAIRKAKDTAPDWTGCEAWSDDQFHKFFKDSMDYYRLEKSAKDLKPEVLRWMGDNDYTKEQVKAFKDTKDNRCSSTVGSIAANLNRGMTAQRDGFNQGRDTSEWLKKEIAGILEAGKNDFEPEPDTEKTVSAPVISIQDRMKEAAARMVEDIEDALENFRSDPEAFDPKQFKVLNLLKGKQAKAAHSRIIKGFYEFELAELEELASGGADEQLKEGYSHLPRKHVKKLIEFYKEIESACDMLAQEQKVNRKPRAKKAQPKEKVVAKIKYLKTHEPLKLVSINPTDIIGAKELWIYNVKTRKLGKYVSAEYQELGVKGASIINFDENRSTQKTLRKPEEKIKEFKAAGKVQLRKFLEDINSVESKMNGRLNEQTILLKVQ
jgi:hypothetical protein